MTECNESNFAASKFKWAAGLLDAYQNQAS